MAGLEQPIVERDHAGDPIARRNRELDFLARRYTQALTRFFQRRVSLKGDIPDLVQEVFVRLARLGDLSGIEKPEQYLFTTAASALHDRARRDMVRKSAAHRPFDENLDGGTDFSPERVLLGRQALQQVRSALLELPERTRDVFVLRAFEDQKMAEVARNLGVSVRAAEKHYVKAMAFLTVRLRESDHAGR